MVTKKPPTPRKRGKERQASAKPAKAKVKPKAKAKVSAANSNPPAISAAGAVRVASSVDAPLAKKASPLIVGLGASAGGLEALETFFVNMPPDSGLAFVVVTHLPLGHKSLMPLLLGNRTRMSVLEAKDGLQVRANHVYTAPSGRTMVLVQDRLHLVEGRDAQSVRLPIDQFFRSLAREKREQAVGIVLSGTGSDGTQGLREIKAAAGLAMVQTQEDARYDAMPKNAIRGDHPDFVLPVAEMPQRLLSFLQTTRNLRTRAITVSDSARVQEALQHIFARLRVRTGHDFSSYKDSTVRRRIERRISVQHLDSIEEYSKFLDDNPGEIDVLFDELLIGVTSFFRDAEAFQSLSEAIALLITGKPDDYSFRVWVAGCSTGEEAYSIAILFREHMERLKRAFTIQIFATDLDPKAIEHARTGLYAGNIVADLDPKQLKRFFTREGESYRVRKDVREMLVFATQNLVEDPPFTKLDLLSCRNLLIYLDAKLQKRIFPIFHYSLKPNGVAFLGSSETIGTFTNLFGPIDKKWKLFRRKEVVGGTYIADIPASISTDMSLVDAPLTQSSARRADSNMSQLSERVLLRELVPPTALIRERGDIVHIHGRTGLFLEPAPGPQNAINIFNMAREGLQLELAAAVREAAREESEVVRRGIRLKGHNATIFDLRVRRLSEPESFRGLLLVSFEPHRSLAHVTREDSEENESRTPPRIVELERELQYTKESHQGTIEELETANEELKSTNEELQSTNEELQSTNEELETSKEELQSLNEELQTVNVELQGKVEELSRANDDMTNLLNATDIATVFLDNDLNIKRHTEQAKRIIRLIPSDVGRSIGDLVSRLRYDGLLADAREVLRTLVFKETEVQGDGDDWYLMRILPYRTTENMIDGLVITFVDITRVKKLQHGESRISAALQSAPVSVFGQDQNLVVSWASGHVFGHKPGDVIGKTDQELLGDELAAELRIIKTEVLRTGQARQHTFSLKLAGKEKRFSLFIDMDRGVDGKKPGVSCVALKLPTPV
jgi:two-component system CheB/CheR fusion protein